MKRLFVFATRFAVGFFALSLCTTQGNASEFHWSQERAAELEAAIVEWKYQTVTSVLVRKGGETIYEGYFNGADVTTRHNTRSVTKTINGMLIGAAIADGELGGVDDKAFSFFKDKKPFANDDKRKRDITIEDLLTMSSQLECDDWNSYSRGNEERMYLVEDMAGFYLDLPMRGYPGWSPTPDKHPYGRAFSYCTAGANLAGHIAARAVGKDLERYAQDRLFTPLGLSEVVWPRTGGGDVMATGGLELTSDALARLAQLYLNGGQWNGERILPEAWVEASMLPKAKINDTTAYGYLWWLMEYQVDGNTHPVSYMSGNGGNRVMVMPDHDMIVIITKTDYGTRGMHQAAQALFEDFIVKNIRSSN